MRNVRTIAIATVCGLGFMGSTAFAADHFITSKDIKDRSVMNRDIRPGTLSENRLDRGVQAKLNRLNRTGPAGQSVVGPKGEKGDRGSTGVTNLESDGPYPGATQLQNGGNSTDRWVADGNVLQRSWVRCAPGKVALGGGFSRADEGTDAFKGLQIVSSNPTQISASGDEVYAPIEGDVDGSFRPNAWMVEGYNNGNTDLIVRPHVICANVQ